MTIAFLISAIICAVIYVISGVFGYLCFLDETRLNIIFNFQSRNALLSSAKLIALIMLLCTFPLVFYACRESLEKLLFSRRYFSWIRFILITIVLMGAFYVLGALIPKIEKIFGIILAVSGTVVMYLMPLILFTRTLHSRRAKIAIWLLLSLCCLVGLVGIIATIFEIIKL